MPSSHRSWRCNVNQGGDSMALKVGELYASFGIDSSGLDSALSGIEKKCSSIAKGLAVTGAAMTATVTRSVVNVAKSIYDSGTNFHAQMSKVGAIANASADDLETLTQKALEMGSTTSFTSKEAGEAMEYMAMAGWKTQDMLDGIKSIMDLAAASGESLGTTSDIVTDALTAFGLSAADSAHFAEVMAAASTNANTNVGMMGESFKYVAPLAGTLGYSIDDVAVALGVMANAGIKSSQAGTSLARILQNMIDPSKEAQEAMKSLGLSLYDSSGKSKSLMQVMNEMRESARKNGVDLNEVQEIVAKLDEQLENGEISEREFMDTMAQATGGSQEFMSAVAALAGTRGLSGMLAIMNASEEDFQKLVGAIENCDGALDEMVAKMLDNAQGDMILFESAVDGLKITLWDLVEGPFRGIIQSGTGVIQMLQGLDSGTQMAALKTAGLAAAAGPAITALGGLIGFAGKLIPIMSAMASPLAIVGAGLGLFAVAAVDADNSIGKMLSNLSKNARKQLNKFDSTISKSMHTVSGRMPKLIDSVVSSIRTLGPGIMNTGMLVIEGFMDAISSNASKLSGIGRELITQVTSGISRYAPNLIPTAANMIGNIASALIENMPVYFRSAVDLGKSLLAGLKNVNWGEIGLNLLRSVISAASGITKELGKLFEDAKNAVMTTDWAEVWESIKSTFTEGGNIIKEAILGDNYTEDSTWGDAGSKIWESIKNGFKSASDFGKMLVLGDDYTPDASWGDVGSKIWKAIKDGIKVTGDWLKEKLGYTPDASWSSVGADLWDMIKSGISATGDWLKEKLGYTPSESWTSIGKTLWEKIKSGVTATGDWIKERVLGDSYTPDASWGTVGQSIWDSIWDGITDISTKLNAKIQDALADLPGFISKLASDAANFLNSGTFANLGESIIGFLSAGIQSKAGGGAAKIIEAITGLFDGINFAELGTDISAAAQGLGGVILNAIVAAINAVETGATSLITAVGGLMQTAFTPENLKSALGTLSDIGGVVIDVIAEAIKAVQSAAVSIYTAIGDLISKIDFENAGIEIGTFVTGLIDKIAEKIGTMNFESVANSLGSLVGKAINGIKSATLGIGQALSNWILSGEVFTTLYNIVKALVTTAWGFFTGLFKEIWDGSWFGSAMNDFLYGHELQFELNTDITFADPDIQDAADALTNRVETMLDMYVDGNIPIEVQQRFTVDALVEDLKMDYFLSDEQIQQLLDSGFMDQLQGLISSAMGETPVEVDVPVSAAAETTETVFDAEAMAAQAQEAVNSAITTASENAPDLTTCGIETATSLATGITESSDLVDTAMKGVSDIITNSANAIDLYSTGQSVVQGLSNGMDSMVGSLMAKARSIAKQLKSTIQSGLQVHSPSRFTKWVGKMVIGGLVNSLDDGVKGVATAAQRVADTVRDQLYLSDPSRETVHTARQSVQETEAAMMRVANVRTLPGNGEKAEQRFAQVTIVLDGQVLGSTLVPIVEEGIGAEIATRR